MDRSSPFSFECAACGQCCRNKRITLFPYEIARLAAACGKSTGEILAEHTDEGGTALLMDLHSGICTFLRDNKCAVHSGRPLACRLYPLGRHSSSTGESFFETPVHAFCLARRENPSTVGAYTDSQDAAPYILASEKYGGLLKQMVLILKDRNDALQALTESISSEQDIASPLLDVDSVIETFCRKNNVTPPTSVEDRITLHLQALTLWISSA